MPVRAWPRPPRRRAARSVGLAAPLIAQSGSFSPWPVTVQTTRSPGAISPSRQAFRKPATLAALDGSTKTPSRVASSLYAARISRSLTARMAPPDSSRAAIACCHEAGLPMRIAVAMVEGRGHDLAPHDGRASGGLEAEHSRPGAAGARLGRQLGVAPPVRGDVAGVADRKAVHRRRPAERVADLEGGRLLTLDPVRIDAVDQRDGVVLGKVLGQPAGSRRNCRRPPAVSPRARAPGPACRARSCRWARERRR